MAKKAQYSNQDFVSLANVVYVLYDLALTSKDFWKGCMFLSCCFCAGYYTSTEVKEDVDSSNMFQIGCQNSFTSHLK